jgi:hypothetical protein
MPLLRWILWNCQEMEPLGTTIEGASWAPSLVRLPSSVALLLARELVKRPHCEANHGGTTFDAPRPCPRPLFVCW